MGDTRQGETDIFALSQLEDLFFVEITFLKILVDLFCFCHIIYKAHRPLFSLSIHYRSRPQKRRVNTTAERLEGTVDG